MSDITIYHNPRCNKSRQALELLKDSGLDVEVIEYLKTRPDAATLNALRTKLGVSAHDMVRVKEAEYSEAGLGEEASDEEILDAIARYPKLLERPIVVRGENAVIGRPPENVRALL